MEKNQRKLLAFGVVLMLFLFLIWYFFFINRDNTQNITNDMVYFQDSKLYVFDKVYTLKQYPDKVLMHYPYLLIIQTDKPLTTVYNLKTKKKENEIHEVLLDYYEGNIVYNKKQTFYNSINLDKYCDNVFIKNENEVLCTFRSNQDSHNNMLISIRPDKPNLWKRVYKSPNYNIIAAISIINNTLYIGEINFDTKKSNLIVKEKTIPVDDIVSMIYEMQGKPYFASFPSVLNGQKENYYMIETGKASRQSGEKIIIYED